jgi:nickel-dependent lactate racemase
MTPPLAVASTCHLRTAAWYADRPIELRFPPGWSVVEHWPPALPPVSEERLRASIGQPVGQAPIRESCRGKRHPVVVVDDLNRPTPAWRVMPYVLEELGQGGIPPGDVTIVMATGTHGAPPPGALKRKVGARAAAACRLEVHDADRRGVRLGTTSFGTPVIANRTVAQSDFVVGIGGIYPNHTAGFGGGAKLALGVLSTVSIARLHYRHDEVGWGLEPDGRPFRRDLEEIAERIRLHTTISLQVDPRGEIVRVACGDHLEYFAEEARFARETFAAPPPGEADVLVANAYPNDLSLTFAKMKGTSVFTHGSPGASRIVIAALTEGGGRHGLFPVVDFPRFYSQKRLLRELAAMTPTQRTRRVAQAIWRKTLGRLRPPAEAREAAPGPPGRPTWVHCTTPDPPALPEAPGVQVRASWEEILAAVEVEQGPHRPLRVAVYPCAPLQWIDRSRSPLGGGGSAR